MSVASELTELTVLFLFRRGVEYFPLLMGYLPLLWLVSVVLARIRKALAGQWPRVIWSLVNTRPKGSCPV